MEQSIIRSLTKVGATYVDRRGYMYRFFWTSPIYRKEAACAEYIQSISPKRHKITWIVASYKLVQSIIRRSEMVVD